MKHRLPALLCALFFFSGFSPADDEDKKDKDEKSFADVVKNCDLKDGLFNLYQDRDDGTVYLAVTNEQLDSEYIHFAYVLDGVPSLGLFRGNFLWEQVLTVRRHFDRIEFVAQNTGFYFDPKNAISKAAEANISPAVLASQEIVATTEDKTTHLIKADDLFLKEFFAQVKRATKDDDKKDRLVLGDLSEDRTRFRELRNYPENSLLRVDYVYENARPKEWGEDDVTDARYITIAVQHALIAMPENDYLPRIEDPRVGYFTTKNTDLTSARSANYRDLVHRWHLKKKNPDAEKSDPVEPITWWIENTTPEELRETIKKGVEAWNPAFESAGFTNAVVCKVQPDDADWDAGDIRYNLLRWTSSPDPPFGGYGPSFVNPRTGQIIGADIMLEYVFLTNRIRLRELLQKTEGAAPFVKPPAGYEDRFPFNLRNRQRGMQFCEASGFLHENTVAAQAILAVGGASEIEMEELIEEALIDLILHEVGHTLGLNHNFLASTLHSPDQIHDKKVTGKLGVISSVMDYTPANISRDRDKQGHYFSVVPGPYDHWAIRFGYTETTPETESEVIGNILAESTKPEHAFGNDADDMRSAGRGIDPRIMTNDLTSDPIGHAIDSMERVRETMDGLAEKFPAKGDTWHELRNAFTSLMRTYDRSAQTLTRYVGGVQIDRSVVGQNGAAPAPFQPIPAAEQKRAAEALEKFVFAPDAFSFIPADLIARLQLQRRGFEHFDLDANEDPKIHSAVASIQSSALNHLLHKNTLQRMVDSDLYGNDYEL
ncbi:MAG: DUF5117 domain-containing protein, partial [Verrucomicrobiales bacterium]|nr:DUF5117 domain-containing protein [Verrucomicrobiales bacterium]